MHLDAKQSENSFAGDTEDDAAFVCAAAEDLQLALQDLAETLDHDHDQLLLLIELALEIGKWVADLKTAGQDHAAFALVAQDVLGRARWIQSSLDTALQNHRHPPGALRVVVDNDWLHAHLGRRHLGRKESQRSAANVRDELTTLLTHWNAIARPGSGRS